MGTPKGKKKIFVEEDTRRTIVRKGKVRLLYRGEGEYGVEKNERRERNFVTEGMEAGLQKRVIFRPATEKKAAGSTGAQKKNVKRED